MDTEMEVGCKTVEVYYVILFCLVKIFSGNIFSLKVIFSCQAILDNFCPIKVENRFLYC